MDVADAATIARWNTAMANKAIPNELDPKLMAEFFLKTRNRMNGSGFGPQDVLPGDQIWLMNPYFAKAMADVNKRMRDATDAIKKDELAKMKKAMSGEEGSNVFWAGDGNVMSIYSRQVLALVSINAK